VSVVRRLQKTWTPPPRKALPVYCDEHDVLMLHDHRKLEWECPKPGCRARLGDEDVYRLSSGGGTEIRVTP
jgi:hypothetical protein